MHPLVSHQAIHHLTPHIHSTHRHFHFPQAPHTTYNRHPHLKHLTSTYPTTLQPQAPQSNFYPFRHPHPSTHMPPTAQTSTTSSTSEFTSYSHRHHTLKQLSSCPLLPIQDIHTLKHPSTFHHPSTRNLPQHPPHIHLPHSTTGACTFTYSTTANTQSTLSKHLPHIHPNIRSIAHSHAPTSTTLHSCTLTHPHYIPTLTVYTHIQLSIATPHIQTNPSTSSTFPLSSTTTSLTLKSPHIFTTPSTRTSPLPSTHIRTHSTLLKHPNPLFFAPPIHPHTPHPPTLKHPTSTTFTTHPYHSHPIPMFLSTLPHSTHPFPPIHYTSRTHPHSQAPPHHTIVSLHFFLFLTPSILRTPLPLFSAPIPSTPTFPIHIHPHFIPFTLNTRHPPTFPQYVSTPCTLSHVPHPPIHHPSTRTLHHTTTHHIPTLKHSHIHPHPPPIHIPSISHPHSQAHPIHPLSHPSTTPPIPHSHSQASFNSTPHPPPIHTIRTLKHPTSTPSTPFPPASPLPSTTSPSEPQHPPPTPMSARALLFSANSNLRRKLATFKTFVRR
ncbi:hypothetical protein C7M84_018616 [Penaeus vannamei]|uniref:Uncharacterized protein n=1 Tax=Penaeus vannamei TaxID=6689 RepID=A0A423SH67_PENVA|nr:hypothetical protein C7M84_018616 [Penaeus vannamei]